MPLVGNVALAYHAVRLSSCDPRSRILFYHWDPVVGTADMSLKFLGVVDAATAVPQDDRGTAIAGAVKRAQVAESLGCSRFWMTEHHDVSLPWASPLPLLALIGSATARLHLHLRSKRDPSEIVRYRDTFRSDYHGTPTANIAMSVACAETHATAKRIARVPRETPGAEPIYGTAAECLEQLKTAADLFVVDEIVVKYEGDTMEERTRACILLMEEFNRSK